jgi:hypothetical protein
MVGSSFVADAATGLDAWINEGVQRLHEKLVEAYAENYIESTSALTIVAGTSSYALPSDFFKLYTVTLNVNGVEYTVKPFMRAEGSAYKNHTLPYNARPRYRLAGSNIIFLPSTLSATGTMYYAPSATVLSASGDTVNFPNGWERFVVLYAAIQALMKEESSVTALQQELQKQEQELDEAKRNRDAALPRQVVDMDLVDFVDGWRFGG